MLRRDRAPAWPSSPRARSRETLVSRAGATPPWVSGLIPALFALATVFWVRASGDASEKPCLSVSSSGAFPPTSTGGLGASVLAASTGAMALSGAGSRGAGLGTPEDTRASCSVGVGAEIALASSPASTVPAGMGWSGGSSAWGIAAAEVSTLETSPASSSGAVLSKSSLSRPSWRPSSRPSLGLSAITCKVVAPSPAASGLRWTMWPLLAT